MAKLNWLQRRPGGTYYIRVKVPKDVVPLLGKKEVTQSLLTKEPREAAVRLRIKAAEIVAEFAALRRKAGPATVKKALSDVELKQLALLWFRSRMQDLNSTLTPATIEPDQIGEVVENIEQDLSWIGDPRDVDARVSMQNSARKLLADQSIALEPTSPSFHALVELMTKAELERLRLAKAELTRESNTMFSSVGWIGQPEAATQRKSVSLSELFESFVSEPGRQHLDPRTVETYRAKFRLVSAVLGGDRSVRSITRDDCKRVQEALNIYPKNATQRFPGRSVAEVLEMARSQSLEPMEPKTARGYLILLSSLLDFGVRGGDLDRNPAKGLKITRAPTKEGRSPFSADALRRIFASEHYRGGSQQQQERAGEFWVPLIGLFTGMRLNECCQLLVSDVTEEGGVWAIHNRLDGRKKRLKTAAAKRVVPVHPELVKIGFIEFVQQCQRATHPDGQLFPELPTGKKGYKSDPFQKSFRRFLNRIGADEPNTSFHSFRHGFNDAMLEAGIPDDRARALGGWSSGGRSARDGYGKGFTRATLLSEISKIHFQGLDLSHLYVDD